MKSDLRINWLIAIMISGWLLYLLAPVLTPFIAAALLAYIGDRYVLCIRQCHKHACNQQLVGDRIE